MRTNFHLTASSIAVRFIILLCCILYTVLGAQETPHNSYAPQTSSCPVVAPLIRSAGTVATGNQALGEEEAIYIRRRRAEVVPGAYRAYLENVQAALGRDRLPSYVTRSLSSTSPDELPRVSAAISGGGLRAAFVGAGVLNAFDGRNRTSAALGTGGLLQALDYLTGLSGGACLVMALAQSNFPSIYEAALGSTRASLSGWLTDMNFVLPAGLSRLASNPVLLDGIWWSTIVAQVLQKYRARFEITVGDIYGRVLAYHFLNGTTRQNFFNPNEAHALGETLSGLANNVPTLRAFSQPFPIITAVPESPNQNISERQVGAVVPVTNNQYEFNIYESGSWDPNLASFVKTSSLGSSLKNGNPIDPKRCLYGFDNLGFLIATSSNIFRRYDQFVTLFIPKAYKPILPTFKSVLSRIPNPFYGLGTDQYLDRETQTLGLMDGSFGGENIPFAPLLSPARQVDVIIAVDASDDHNGWADGTSLINTAKRSSLMPPHSYPFPKIPSQALNINTSRPTFFGCDNDDDQARGRDRVPLVIYIPNSPPQDGSDPVTNLPTIAIEASRRRAIAVMDGGTRLGTRVPSSSDRPKQPLWSTCLACAIVDRSRERLHLDREGVCLTCFKIYCSSH